MADPAVVFRLNVIIVLLLAILAILLWPLLPSLLFYGILVLFVATAAAMVWALT